MINLFQVLIKDFDIFPVYCVSLHGYTWQCGIKYNNIKLQTLQDKDLIYIRGGISSVRGDRYIKSDEDKKILYMDANKLYGHSISQVLPNEEIKTWHGQIDLYMTDIEQNLNNSDHNDIVYFLEVDIKHPENIKQKT